MKKFEFRLQTLLKLREQVEGQKKRVVAELVQQINQQQQEALELNAAMREQGEILKKQRASGQIDVSWFGNYRSYVTHIQQAIQQRVQNVKEIQKQLMIARHELAEAAKETKVLEKLKQKRRERYDYELQLAEAREQDEISKNIFLRKTVSA
ncbi:MAG: flagellar export protein FliJ [Sedimentisphaerales bacterium]|nr:flagellar export protein FliJ [Sedimentisphaerales bacterium]